MVQETAEGRPRPVQTVAGFKQRLIEGAPVVGDEHAKGFQVLCQAGEQAGLLAVIAHQKLPHTKAIRRDAAHAHQKRAGAGAAGQAGGFGIEKRPLPRGNIANRAMGQRFEQVRRHFREIGDLRGAVPAMGGIKRFELKMFPVFRLDFLAREALGSRAALRRNA